VARIQFSIRTILVALLLICVALAIGLPWFFSPKVVPLELSGGFSSAYVGGHSYVTEYSAELTPDLFDGQPTWYRNSSNPPFSADDAMVTADKFLRKTYTEMEFPNRTVIDSVELSPFDPENGHWFWTVRFRCLRVGGFVPSIDLAVLMDGSVVTPTETDRIDIGWPLPNADVDEKPPDKTDQQIVSTFVSDLNPHRSFAGQTVKIIGQVSRMPDGHLHQATGRRFHLILDDGSTLIFESPGGWAMRFDTDLEITGQLVGFREYNERDPNWGDLTLYPGIRVRSIGVYRKK
jgi:hypothetical protein